MASSSSSSGTGTGTETGTSVEKKQETKKNKKIVVPRKTTRRSCSQKCLKNRQEFDKHYNRLIFQQQQKVERLEKKLQHEQRVKNGLYELMRSQAQTLWNSQTEVMQLNERIGGLEEQLTVRHSFSFPFSNNGI